MLVYVESAPISVVNAPTKPPSTSCWIAIPSSSYSLHELGQLARVHVVVALLDDDHQIGSPIPPIARYFSSTQSSTP